MICDDAAEYISALCDGQTIRPEAAQHFAGCPNCQQRLSDYLAMGVELRRTASLALAEAVPLLTWTKPQNLVAKWWQEGWRTMRIPRLAFAVLVASVVVLGSGLAVNTLRANNTGTVVLLSVTGPNGPLEDCPLSTLDKSPFVACQWYGKIGSQSFALKIKLLSRGGNRVLLAIRTLTFKPGTDLSAFANGDVGPGRQIWFEPGEPLKFDVGTVGSLTLTGTWMDHVPVLGKLDPGPNELRLGSPLLLKDNVVVGDLSGAIGGVYGQDHQDEAMAFYVPGEGRFLISQLPMKAAVQAQVRFNRISFEEGGHSWDLVSGVPVCRADHVWVLHQPDYKMKIGAGDRAAVGDIKLVQTEPGVWAPQEMPN